MKEFVIGVNRIGDNVVPGEDEAVFLELQAHLGQLDAIDDLSALIERDGHLKGVRGKTIAEMRSDSGGLCRHERYGVLASGNGAVQMDARVVLPLSTDDSLFTRLNSQA